MNELTSGYNIKHVCDTKELKQHYEAFWETITKHNDDFDINAQIDHFILVNEKYNAEPHVLLIEKDNVPQALLAGRIEQGYQDLTFGFIRLFKFKMNICTFIFGGVLCTPDESVCNHIIESLRILQKKRNVDLIRFSSCNSGSLLFRKICEQKLVIISKPQRHHKYKLPGTVEEYLESKSKSHRKNLNYYSRKLKKDFHNILVAKFTGLDDFDKLMEDGETIASKTYQRGMNEGFINDVLTRSRFLLAAKKGWLRCYILYLDNTPVSFQMGFEYDGCYYVQGKGYIPELSNYRVGTYLSMQVLEDLINDPNMFIWDFGMGDAEYKRNYSTTSMEERFISLHSPTIRNVLIYSIMNIFSIISKTIENIIVRVKLKNKIKKIFKIYLTPKKNKLSGVQ